MSNSASTPDSRLTVEDAGSTTDPADLVDDDATRTTTTGGGAHAATAADTAPTGTSTTDTASAGTASTGTSSRGSDLDDLPSAPGATTSGLSSLVAEDDGSIGHVFDQTNGVVDRLDGDSDGTAESDELSAEERRDEDPAFEAFADTEPARASDTDDPRTTGN